MLDCDRFSGDLALRPLCCARMILLKEAMTQKASKDLVVIVLKRGVLVWASRVCGYEEFSSSSVLELDPQTMAVESVLFRKNPRLHLAAALLVATAPRPPMGAMPAPAAPLGTKRKSTFADVLRATPETRTKNMFVSEGERAER